MRRILLLVLLILAALNVNAASIKIETPGNDVLYSSQPLIFSLCAETPTFSLTCIDTGYTEKIEAIEWNGSCYMGVYNLDKIKCTSLSITAKYKENNSSQSITKAITIKPTISYPTALLNQQNWDGSFGSSIETAQAIWVLSAYGTKYKESINNALEWLKTNRDDNYKCWPYTGCTTKQTAKTLAFLKLAKLNSSSRIVADALSYLEDKQNYIESKDWGLVLSVNTDNNCTLDVGSTSSDLTVYENASTNLDLTAEYGTKINLTCEYSAEIQVRDNYNMTIAEISGTDNLYYQIPYACWGGTKWNGCSTETTLYAAYNNITKVKRDLAIRYLADQETRGRVTGKYLPTTNELRDTAFYLKGFGYKQDVANYLIFKQNNDGSFGDGALSDKFLTTGYVIFGLDNLTNAKSKEVVRDAKSWMQKTYIMNNINSVETNAFFFYSSQIKDRFVIRSMPEMVNLTTKSVNVTLFNLWGRNITKINVTISSGLQGKIDITKITNISSYGEKYMIITPKSGIAGKYTGFITISKNSTEIAKIPVIFYSKPIIEIGQPKDIHIMGTHGKISFPLSSITGDFSCNLNVAGLTSKASAKSGQKTLDFDLNFKNEERLKETVEAIVVCKSGQDEFRKNYNLIINRYPSEIISIAPSELMVTDYDQSVNLIVTNLINEPLEITAAIVGESEMYFEINQSSAVIDANDTANITINTRIKHGINVTTENFVVITYLGKEDKIPLSVNVVVVPFPITTIIITILLIIFIGAGVYLWIYLKKNPDKKKRIMASLNKATFWKKQKGPAVVEHVPRHTGMEDIIKIMKGLGKDEKQIAARLKDEGFTDIDIKRSLINVQNELEGKEELNKEENAVKIMRAIEGDTDTIRAQLKQKGFNDEQINATFQELEVEIKDKEKKLSEQLKRDDGF